MINKQHNIVLEHQMLLHCPLDLEMKNRMRRQQKNEWMNKKGRDGNSECINTH